MNSDKIKGGSLLRLKFLGISFGVGHNGACVRPAKQSEALKLLTKRNRGISLTEYLKKFIEKCVDDFSITQPGD
ncbi:hypothetical protein BFD03_05605 [Limosilactobacillus reuteri]|uniref:Uncharacterized protein n=1 Tax=Limosilactobacillus reuteri TaxID=1598 RepID=A0A1C2G9T8_LIMRT|nr:hypothetical protein BFD03_05605 [Limosilactobacillus reuteri]